MMRGTYARTMPIGVALAPLSLSAGKASAETTVRYWGPVAIPAPGPNQHGAGHVSEVAGLTGVVEFLASFSVDTADYPVNQPCSGCYITESSRAWCSTP